VVSNLSIPVPDEPTPRDVELVVTEAERILADATPPAPTPATTTSTPPPASDAPPPMVTDRVRRLAAEVTEARHLVALQGDDTPLRVDTDRVRRRRKQSAEARALHHLGQDPATRAYQAARVRRWITIAAMVSLGLALAWSTAGVQRFAAGHATTWQPAWVLAWFAEPFVSLALLVIVGSKAYLATRGQPIESRALDRLEWGFLALTLGMNGAPYTPWEATPFDLPTLVLHCLGPLVAVAIVTALPIIWAAFAALDHGDSAATLDRPDHQQKSRPDRGPIEARSTRSLDELLDELLRLAEAGVPVDVTSAESIRRVLRCAPARARQVRDALSGGA
jgi:hypothetical protein